MMEEQKVALFFMGQYDAFTALDSSRDDDDASERLSIVNVAVNSEKQFKAESMALFAGDKAKEQLKRRLEEAELIFLHGKYEAHLQKIREVEGCLDVIKRKRVFIMNDVDAAAKIQADFGLPEVTFIPTTRPAFQKVVDSALGIVRDTSPKKAEPLLARQNPYAPPSPPKAREAAVDEAAAEAERLERRNGKKEEADVSVVPVPPRQPVPVKVVVPEINVAFFGEPDVGQADVIGNLNVNEGVAVIKGEEFYLDGRLPKGKRDAVCLMWDASRPDTLTKLLGFIGHESFRNAPLIFVAWNAENAPQVDPRLTSFVTEGEEELVAVETLEKQKAKIQTFVNEHQIEHHAIMDVKSNHNIVDIGALKTKIVEFARLATISFTQEVKSLYQRMKHSRQVRTEHLKEVFKKEPLEGKDIEWLLLHRDSVTRHGETARSINTYLEEKGIVDFQRLPLDTAVQELLALLDQKERLIYPKMVMFFRSESFATDYITKNYDTTRKAILDVAERYFYRKPGATKDEILNGLNVPPEVHAILDRHAPAQPTIAPGNVTFR